jgi:hypothetical protein
MIKMQKTMDAIDGDGCLIFVANSNNREDGGCDRQWQWFDFSGKY